MKVKVGLKFPPVPAPPFLLSIFCQRICVINYLIRFPKYLFHTPFIVGRKIEPEDVQHKKGNNGYDLKSIVSIDNNNLLRIEVKGATRYHGIPDPYITEFNKETGEMTANFLYVVYFPRKEDVGKCGSKPILYKIPRAAIRPGDLKPKCGWRIKDEFKKRMDDFEDPVPER